MNNSLIIDFCLECTIPGILSLYDSDNILKDRGRLIDAVVKKAKTDADKGSRNDRDYRFRGTKNAPHKAYSNLIRALNACDGVALPSSEYIKQLTTGRNTVSHAYAQKIVNMSMKYLFVIQCLKGEINGLHINIDYCDCPIDSEILKKLKKFSKQDYVCWTKQNLKMYNRVQNDIKKYSADPLLLFDFNNWKK